MFLYITEYQHAAVDQGRALPVGGGAPVAKQKIDFSGGVINSAAFSQFTHLIRVHNDSAAPCSVLVSAPGGPIVSASTSDGRMAQNQTEYFGVDPGGALSVIQNS